eukprot:2466067-Rhodomonas_salina.1
MRPSRHTAQHTRRTSTPDLQPPTHHLPPPAYRPRNFPRAAARYCGKFLPIMMHPPVLGGFRVETEGFGPVCEGAQRDAR